METTRLERYWSFSFWLRKSLWLGMTAMAAWMLWQFITRDARITDDSVFFTNSALRVIGGLLFAYLIYYFGSRFWINWRKDASIEQPFTTVLDEPDVQQERLVDEPFVQEKAAFSTPPPTPPPFAEAPQEFSEPATMGSLPVDDLTKVEGIGPEIARLLQDASITTFSVLASQTTEQLESVLSNAGANFRFHDPTDWPQQAQMIVDGQWQDLEDLQKARN